MATRNEKRGIAAMLLLSISYGIAGYTARELQQHFGIWQQIAAQSWLAWVIGCGIQAISPNESRPWRLSSGSFSSLFWRAAIGRIVSSFFYIEACLHAPLGNVGWISALPTSAFFGWCLFGQCVSRREWGLLSLGMLGVGIIVGPVADRENIVGRGEMYALVSVFATGLAALCGRTVVREQGAFFATRWVLLITAVLASFLAVSFEGGLKMPPIESLPVLIGVALMVLVSSACSLYGYTYLRASTATGLLSLEAIWGVALGMLVYGEWPTSHSLVGGIVIVVVAYLVASGGEQQMRAGVQSSSDTVPLMGKELSRCGS